MTTEKTSLDKLEKRNLTFTSDPGHGWLSVSLKDVITLGIKDKISSCSYMTLTRAYLEEDCDASVFINAAKEQKWEINIKNTNVDVTPIRNYASFDVEKVELALNFKEGKQISLFNKTKEDWSTQGKIVEIAGNAVYMESEFGARYKSSKTKILSYIKPATNGIKPKIKM